MTLYDVINHKLVWALFGALVSVVVAYFTFSRDILREIFQLKGQSLLLLRRLEAIDRIQEILVGVNRDTDRLKYDLNNCWTEVRKLRPNGKDHGTER